MLAGHYFTFFFFFFSCCTEPVSDDHGPQCSLGHHDQEELWVTKLLMCIHLGHFCRKKEKKKKRWLQLLLRTLEMEIEPGFSWVCRESEKRVSGDGKRTGEAQWRLLMDSQFQGFLVHMQHKENPWGFFIYCCFLLLFLCYMKRKLFFFFFTVQLLRIFFFLVFKKVDWEAIVNITRKDSMYIVA